MKKILLIIIGASLLASSCNKINLLTLSEEKQLGLQSKQQIESDPQQFPILNRAQYPEVYTMLESMRNDILASGSIRYKDEFAWEIHVINDPNTLNAFCTPGGYIYFYTGLMKYLDNSSAVAGVMGHEMAHADRRHSGKQITNQMGLQIVLSIIAGTGGQDIAQVVNIAAGLTNLQFGRSMETEADEYSVKYLCPTTYQTDGAAQFFRKLIENNQTGQTPAFLSTHPAEAKRVKNIEEAASATTGCVSTKNEYPNYKQIVTNLP